MPPIEIVWFLVLATAISFVVASFFLRLSCTLANCVGHKTRRGAHLQVPGYGSCLGIVFVAVFVMSLLEGVVGPIVAPVAQTYFHDTTLHVAALCLRAILFAMLVAMGLRSDPRTPRSLAALASSLHLILLIVCIMLARGVIAFAAAGEPWAA